jgi:YD repeat-containing protein
VTGAGKIVLAGSQTQSFTYDAAGRLTASSFSGSITEARTYVYDSLGRLVSSYPSMPDSAGTSYLPRRASRANWVK